MAFRKVLVANRGEIAVRIIQTLHDMGFEAVSIYSDEDANSPHVRDADVALHLSGDNVGETYLNASQILELAINVAADAIIPGYDFLSENAQFARSVEEAGMVWVGPTPGQISMLGLKHVARYLADSEYSNFFYFLLYQYSSSICQILLYSRTPKR
jgi:urea carboxylase/allophanate hydrolase